MDELRQLQEQQHQMIVTSCDDTDDCNEDLESVGDEVDSINDNDDDIVQQQQEQQKPDADFLFDEDADDEDEAYVYKHLRSGMIETVNILHQQQSETEPTSLNNLNCQDDSSCSKTSTMISSSVVSSVTQQQQRPHPNIQKLKVLKPRNTDAVLSCPCCFHIVCMDCQRHTSYRNQYRAMFVMNIIVRWDIPLQYNNDNRCLTPYVMQRQSNTPNTNPGTNVVADINDDSCLENTKTIVTNHNMTDMNTDRTSTTIYYTVCCANCQTTVAALDMIDEVYHFSGCLASA